MTDQTKSPVTASALQKEMRLSQSIALSICRIIHKTDDPEIYQGVAAWVRSCHNEPAWHEKALYAIDQLSEGCGVEYSPFPGEPFNDAQGYSYINTGHSDVATIAYSHKLSEFYIACWSDLADEVRREGWEESWNDWAASEFESHIKTHLDLCDIHDQGQRFRELFDWACEKSGCSPELNGSEFHLDWDEIVGVVTVKKLDEYEVSYEAWEDSSED